MYSYLGFGEVGKKCFFGKLADLKVTTGFDRESFLEVLCIEETEIIKIIFNNYFLSFLMLFKMHKNEKFILYLHKVF